MQESRLFQIIYYLLDNGLTTAPELAQKLEVSVRTIYRDIDALSAAGIPVYTEPGRNGGIRLMNDFVLNKVILSDKEKQDILSSMQNLSIANSDYTRTLLDKLSALFNLPAENWYEVDFSRWNKTTQDNEKFETIKYAVIHHIVTKIFYVSSSGQRKERCIQPLKLFYKSKEWYVKAFCLENQDFRLFKMNRIIRYELLNETFTPMTFPDKTAPEESMPDKSAAVLSSDAPESLIRLRFSKEASYRVYDEFDESQIEVQSDGTLIACAVMPQDEWLTGYLLSFGTQVEIIEPLYLRNILAKRAHEIWKHYQNG